MNRLFLSTKILNIIVQLFLITIISSCAPIFTTKTKVVLVSETKGVSLSMHYKSLNKDKFKQLGNDSLKLQLNNNLNSIMLKCEKDGYRTITLPIYPTRYNKVKIADYILPVIGYIIVLSATTDIGEMGGVYQVGAAFIGTITMFWGPSRLFEKKYKIPALIKQPSIKKSKYNIVFNSINIEKDNELYCNKYFSFNSYENSSLSSKQNLLIVKSEVYKPVEDALNTILKKEYCDTTAKTRMDFLNNTTLNAKIEKYEISRVDEYAMVYLKVKWELLDYSGKNILGTKEIKSSSNWSVLGKELDSSLINIFTEALEVGMREFVHDSSVAEILNKNFTLVTDNWNEIEIKQEKTEESNIEKAIQSVVTIKTEDGHASGCIISPDGYIITNYHVTGYTQKPIEVIFDSGKKMKCKVVRENPIYDLTLLKIDTTNLEFFKIDKDYKIDIGSDIYAIGTPEDIELGQTLSKGIVSGKRNIDNISLLQTDCSVNSGNSGGALISKEAILIGIVNSKLIGFGVEGIAFAIPIEYIEEALKIKFK